MIPIVSQDSDKTLKINLTEERFTVAHDGFHPSVGKKKGKRS